MTYRERLNHWAIVRLLPNLQNVIVARFRNRSDADGHLRFLQQHIPQAKFVVIFDDPASSPQPANPPQARSIPADVPFTPKTRRQSPTP
ncbi:MAG TPA: hypothetical protein V6D10_08440 [Trichocoleus sp.]